jgi:hypothetical protein
MISLQVLGKKRKINFKKCYIHPCRFDILDLESKKLSILCERRAARRAFLRLGGRGLKPRQHWADFNRSAEALRHPKALRRKRGGNRDRGAESAAATNSAVLKALRHPKAQCRSAAATKSAVLKALPQPKARCRKRCRNQKHGAESAAATKSAVLKAQGQPRARC